MTWNNELRWAAAHDASRFPFSRNYLSLHANPAISCTRMPSLLSLSVVALSMQSSLDDLYSDLCAAIGRWVLASHFSLLSRNVVASKPTSRDSTEGINSKEKQTTQTEIKEGKPLQSAEQDLTPRDADPGEKQSADGRDPSRKCHSGNDHSRNDPLRSTAGNRGGASQRPVLVEEHGRIPTAVVFTGGSIRKWNATLI